jgi:UDP-N-acetylmuramate dehydrogenase
VSSAAQTATATAASAEPDSAASRSLLGDADRARLAELAGAAVHFDEPMSRHSTLKLGGPADALVSPTSVAQLAAVLGFAAERGLPVIPVGSGSNLLVRDGGVRGLVIATRALRSLERFSAKGEPDPAAWTEVRVGAGVSTGKLLSMATKWELGGLEFLGGVPGSVGGGMIMNAGTYLGEFTSVTTHVTSVRIADGAVVRRDHAACGFTYRGSALPKDEIVVEAELSLTPRPRPAIEADVAGLRQRRHEREPKKVHNAGSTFKNPPGEFAGRLIETAGLKGTRIGDALCSPVHANWLVNVDRASARDLLALIDVVRRKVQEVHGVTLELEVKVIGED